MYENRSFARALPACIFALGLSYSQAEASPLPQYDVALASLKERYRQNTIYLTGDQLSGFRWHLTNLDSRKRLDLEPQPIPEAAKLLENYLAQIFPEMFNPAARVVFLQIDFAARRAHVKRASDNSGTIQELPWSESEVIVIAILVHKLLTGSEVTRQARISIDNKPDDLQSHWSRMPDIIKDPFGSDHEKGLYLRRLGDAIKQNPASLERLRRQDQRAYSEMNTFSGNLKLLEEKGTEGMISPMPSQVNPNNTIWVLNTGGYTPVRFPEYEKAIEKTLIEQAVRAQNLERVTSEEASALVRERLLPAYVKSIQDARSVGQFPANVAPQQPILPRTFQLNPVAPSSSPATMYDQQTWQPPSNMNQVMPMQPLYNMNQLMQTQPSSNTNQLMPMQPPSNMNRWIPTQPYRNINPP